MKLDTPKQLVRLRQAAERRIVGTGFVVRGRSVPFGGWSGSISTRVRSWFASVAPAEARSISTSHDAMSDEPVAMVLLDLRLAQHGSQQGYAMIAWIGCPKSMSRRLR